MYEKRKLSFQNHYRGSAFFENSKIFIVQVGGWVVGGWMGIKRVLRFGWKSGIATKKNVLILNLASKIVYCQRSLNKKLWANWVWKFEEVDFRLGNQLKKWWSQKTFLRGEISGKLKKKAIEKNDFNYKNLKKTGTQKMTPKVV